MNEMHSGDYDATRMSESDDETEMNEYYQEMCNKPCDCDIGVHFDTDYTYPLGSNYIGWFGGKEWAMWDLCEYTWSASELLAIAQRLEQLGNLPLFEQFPKTVAGTQELYESLANHGHSKFRFGCVLYHQLTYTQELKGQIQTGQCGSRLCWHQTCE